MVDVPKPSFLGRLRRFLVGAPIPTAKAQHEKLSPFLGLAVFASDNLSSVAYATEAILSILILWAISPAVAPGVLQMQFPISISIVGLIAIIAFSYRQTIKAYPGGGGSYIVASDNLGSGPGVVAGAALLIDYVLTVAVSIAAGVAAMTSAVPQLHAYLVPLSILAIAIVAWANLRGVRESGMIFALPTYGFVLTMFLVLGLAIWRSLASGPVEQVVHAAPTELGREASLPLLFIILRAFAAGCTALTGIEAVADGTQAFRPPESRNASKTLMRMVVVLSISFLGMGYAALHLPEITILPTKDENFRTVASQVGAYAFGSNTHPGFYVFQGFTALILVLAANTAFADFPRLSSFLARDGFLPRYMARQGDRLVFHNGIIVLAGAAMVLVWVFHGELDQLLPLYAVGVFTAFSLSQAGMVAHWRKTQESGWRRSIVINIVGTILCIAVLLIILVTKFTEGAWLVAILLPAICGGLISIRRRYGSMARQLELPDTFAEPTGHIALLLVPRVHRGVINALNYARQLKGDCQAVHVTLNEKTLPELQRRWSAIGGDVPLVVLPSPYRSLIQPVLDYVDELREKQPDVLITVIVAEAVSTKWYQKLLTENVAVQLKKALGERRNVIVANTRYFME